MRTTLKIAVVRQQLVGGGGEIFAKNILNSLQLYKNIDATIISRKLGHEASNNKTILLDPFFVGRAWRTWSFSRAVCHIIHTKHFDIIQTNERITCGDIYRSGDGVHREWLKIKTRNNILQKILTYISPFHQYLLYAEKKIYNSMEIISPSTMIRDEIIKNYHIDPSKIHIINNYVDNNKYTPELRNSDNATKAKIKPDNINLLFSGHGYKRKGLIYALSVIKELPNNYCLNIIGKDSKPDYWKKCCINLKIEDRVNFLGSVSNPEIYYANSDILIHLAEYEPFGNVVIESLSCGTPVIISNKVGASDIVTDGQNGYIVHDNNIDEIKKRILWIMNTSNIKCIRENCRKSVANHTQTIYLKRLIELYSAYTKQ